jgi:ribosome-associated toxin RatA of RatAB toxin-antitoxin module
MRSLSLAFLPAAFVTTAFVTTAFATTAFLTTAFLAMTLLTVTARPAAAQDLAPRAASLGPSIEARPDRTEGADGVRYGIATGVVEAPIADVMGVITDYANYSEFMPNFNQSRVLSRRGDSALVYLQASVLRDTVTVWAQMRIAARRPRGATQIVEGRMTDGNLSHFIARWEVTPVDAQRTLVEFRVLFVPDLPFPDSLVTGENVAAARRTVRNLRRRVAAR